MSDASLEVHRRTPSWLLIALWALITAVSWVLLLWGLPLPFIKREFGGITPAGSLAIIALCLFGSATGISAGAISGVGHFVLLRKLSPSLGSPMWILLTVAGMLIGTSLGANLGLYATFTVDFPPEEAFGISSAGEPMLIDLVSRGALVGAFIGIVPAIFQWLVLRKQVKNAYLWIVASALGGALSVAAYHVAYLAAGGPLSSPNYGSSVTWEAYFAARSSSDAIGKLVAVAIIAVISGVAARFLFAGRSVGKAEF